MTNPNYAETEARRAGMLAAQERQAAAQERIADALEAFLLLQGQALAATVGSFEAESRKIGARHSINPGLRWNGAAWQDEDEFFAAGGRRAHHVLAQSLRERQQEEAGQ